MRVLSVTQARRQLYRLLDEVARDAEPIYISGPRSEAVLVSAHEWRSIEATLYLQSIPGMADSIKLGVAAPLADCDTEPGWE